MIDDTDEEDDNGNYACDDDMLLAIMNMRMLLPFFATYNENSIYYVNNHNGSGASDMIGIMEFDNNTRNVLMII